MGTLGDMPAPVLHRPDALVLGAGGILGEAWMTGLLAGLGSAREIDYREVEVVLATSAGSIVGARLIAGEPLGSPKLPEDYPEPEPMGRRGRRGVSGILREASRVGLSLAGPLAPIGLKATAPAGAFARSALLASMPRPTGSLSALRRDIDALGVEFDGRLRVVALDRARGRRVVFGSPGAPPAEVADAVVASCSVPWLFRPVRIAGREYIDGGAWSPTNLDAVPAGRDTQVLCLTPTGHIGEVRQTPWGVVRALSSSTTAVEAAALRRRGAKVLVVAPDERAAAAMGEDYMDAGPREDVLGAGYRQGASLADQPKR